MGRTAPALPERASVCFSCQDELAEGTGHQARTTPTVRTPSTTTPPLCIYTRASPLSSINVCIYRTTSHLLSTNRWCTPGGDLRTRIRVSLQSMAPILQLCIYTPASPLPSTNICIYRTASHLLSANRWHTAGWGLRPRIRVSLQSLAPTLQLCIYTPASPLSSTNICIYRTATRLLSTNRPVTLIRGLHTPFQATDRITKWFGRRRRRASGSRPAPSADRLPSARGRAEKP